MLSENNRRFEKQIKRDAMKKNVILLVVILLWSFLVGCQRAEADMPLEVNTYHETMVPPENGWTDKDINSVLYINGKRMSFPFTFMALGEGFSYTSDEVIYNNNTANFFINYGNKDFAYGKVQINTEKIIEKSMFCTFQYGQRKSGDQELVQQLMYFNGITLGSTYVEVQQALGKTAELYENGNNYSYTINGELYEVIILGSYDENGVARIIIKEEK